MTDRDVLAMPAPRFWLLHKNIDRIAAEADHRMLMVGLSAGSSEGATKFAQILQTRVGTIVEVDEGKARMREAQVVPRDRAGLMELKRMGRL